MITSPSDPQKVYLLQKEDCKDFLRCTCIFLISILVFVVLQYFLVFSQVYLPPKEVCKYLLEFIREDFRHRGCFKHYGVYVAFACLKKISRRRYFLKEKSAPSRRSLSCLRPRTRLEGQKRSKHFSSAFEVKYRNLNFVLSFTV